MTEEASEDYDAPPFRSPVEANDRACAMLDEVLPEHRRGRCSKCSRRLQSGDMVFSPNGAKCRICHVLTFMSTLMSDPEALGWTQDGNDFNASRCEARRRALLQMLLPVVNLILMWECPNEDQLNPLSFPLDDDVFDDHDEIKVTNPLVGKD